MFGLQIALAPEFVGSRHKAGNNGGFLKSLFDKQPVHHTRLIDTGAHQHRIAVSAYERGFGFHIHQNIGNDLFEQLLARLQFLHRCPALADLRFCQIGKVGGFQIKPFIKFFRRTEILPNIPRLIAQIQYHAVLHRLVKGIGVDISTEHFHRFLFVCFQQRRAGKADKQGVRQDFLHRRVQLARLRAVAFVHKDENIALRHKIRAGAADFADKTVGVIRRVVIFFRRCAPEFVHQRTHQRGRRAV